MRDIIANIIDPHSFMPDNSGCDLTAEMVKQGKSLAYSKTDRIFEALASAGLPDEPTRSPLTGRDEMIFGACSQCGTRQHLARTENGGFICGSCSDANYLAEWIDYSRELRLLASPAPEKNVQSFQDRVADAHHALFHDDPTDVAERVARFFEEAVETCQALGMTHYDADKLLNYTFDRPVGDPAKEIGSAMLTLASLCVVAGYDMAACGEADLENIQRPETIARIRAKRSTRHGRGPLPGLDPALAATEGSADV